MSARRQRTEVRLEDRARERQIAKAVVVDQALDDSARGGWIARELGHARIVAGNRCVEVAVDTTGRRLGRPPSRITGMREPCTAVRDGALYIRETVEVIAVPNIQPRSSAALAAHAEVGNLRSPVPALQRGSLWDLGDDVLVSARFLEGTKNVLSAGLNIDPCNATWSCLRLRDSGRLYDLHTVFLTDWHCLLRNVSLGVSPSDRRSEKGEEMPRESLSCPTPDSDRNGVP
jgi:hypothetical protein